MENKVLQKENGRKTDKKLLYIVFSETYKLKVKMV